MARVTTYLNFAGNTEEAFLFYQSVFKTEFVTPIMRFGDAPPTPGQPAMPPDFAKMVMHVSLPILGGHVLMGTDAGAGMGEKFSPGNNVHLNLEPDTRAETDRLFAALGVGGKVVAPLAEMFWGSYWGRLTDRFGIYWMFNCPAK